MPVAMHETDLPELSSILSSFAAQASFGIAVVVPPAWDIIYANPVFQHAIQAATPPLGHTLPSVMPDSAGGMAELLREALTTGRTCARREVPVLLLGKPPTWWDFEYIPMRTPGGRPNAIMVISREVTGQVRAREQAERAQEALRADEQRLRLAVEARHMFWWDWDLSTGRVTWADGLEAALGMPPGAFGGTPEAFAALLHPDDRENVQRVFAAALAEGAPLRCRFRMIRADGSVRWTLAHGTILRAPTGEPLRAVGIDMDISDQRAAEDATRLLETVINSITDSVTVRDLDGRYVFANAAAARRLGVAGKGGVTGRRTADLLPAAQWAMIEPELRKVVDTGRP